MVDTVTPAKRSEMMVGIKGKNTKPEILIRKLLHSLGFRFRLHNASLPGRPDIVLMKYKKVVFVQGCFWHGHANCHIFRLPKSRTDFWRSKISGNKHRDSEKTRSLIEAGWRILYVWECATKGKNKLDEVELAHKLAQALIHDQSSLVQIEGA